MVKDGDRLKLRVYFTSAQPTSLKLVVFGEDGLKKIEKGVGWDFLKPFVEKHNNFRHCRVKTVVTPLTIWSVAGKCGVTVKAEQLVIDTTEKTPYSGMQVAEAYADEDLL